MHGGDARGRGTGARHEYGRPRFVEFYNCTNIEMAGITVRDSPFWTVNFYNSSNVWAFMFAYLSTSGVLTGWDASGHIAEETKNASLASARGTRTKHNRPETLAFHLRAPLDTRPLHPLR